MRAKLLGLVALIVSMQANAVTVTNDNRFVVASAEQQNAGYYEERRYDSSAVQGQEWTRSATQATSRAQQSSLPYGTLAGGELGFYAQGSATTYTEGSSSSSYREDAASVFDITLMMDQDMNLAMSSSIVREFISLGNITGPGVGVTVYAGTTEIFSQSGSSKSGTFNYLLEAGQEYRIRAAVGGFGNSIGGNAQNGRVLTSSFDIEGVMTTVVPLPAAVWLFGSALAGLGWMRRRQAV